MGGNCGKGKRAKRPPSSESEDSEDSESSSSKSSKSSKASSGRESSKGGSSKNTSNTRPKTSTKATTTKQTKVGNDQLYRKLNQKKKPSSGKKTVVSSKPASAASKTTSSSAYSKMYLNAKDINSKEALLLLPKEKKGKQQPEMNIPPGCTQFQMEYFYQESPYELTTAKQVYYDQGQQMFAPIAGHEDMVKWEKTAVTPQGQQYQYYFDQKKEVPGFSSGGGHYYHMEKTQYQSPQRPPFPPPATNKVFVPGIPNPYNPYLARPGFYSSSNFAQQQTHQLAKLQPLPPPPPEIVMPSGYRQHLHPPNTMPSKLSPSRPATADQLAALNRNIDQLAANQVTADQLNQNFRTLKAVFEKTVRDLRSGNLTTSRIGQSGSTDAPNAYVSRLQNRYQTIASNVDTISRIQPSSANRPASPSKLDNAMSAEDINEKIEQLIRELDQLKSQYKGGGQDAPER